MIFLNHFFSIFKNIYIEKIIKNILEKRIFHKIVSFFKKKSIFILILALKEVIILKFLYLYI